MNLNPKPPADFSQGVKSVLGNRNYLKSVQWFAGKKTFVVLVRTKNKNNLLI
jgi:hypothetical protein